MDPNSKRPEDIDFNPTEGSEADGFLDELGAEDLLGRDIDLEGPGDWEYV